MGCISCAFCRAGRGSIVFLLKAEEIRYCKLRDMCSGETDSAIGILYLNKIFVKLIGGSFEDIEEAAKTARKMMDFEPDFLPVIVVYSGNECSLFKASYQLEFESFQDCPSPLENSKFSLKLPCNNLLALKMRNSEGLIRDRRVGIKLFRKCFSAQVALTWVISTYNISRIQAYSLFQSLLDERFIYALNFDPTFRDNDALYRFYDDEVF